MRARRRRRSLRVFSGGVVAAVLFLGSNLDAQQVTGRVTDTQSGQPIAAVQVFIAGSGLGALSQANGRYLLLNVPPGTHTLTAERIGYGTVTRQITVTGAETVVQDFTLTEAALGLDEIVVTGTAGGGRQREVGAAVSRVVGEQLTSARADMASALQGRAAGLRVLPGSGQPGASGTIVLRGSNSVSMSNDPLVYIDGVRIYSSIAGGGRRGYSPLSNLRPQDIERVEIVRGPAATTLYGTEASAGVIQIFTKRGVTGAPQWSAEVTGGLTTIGHVGPPASSGNIDGLGHNQCVNRVTAFGVTFSDVTCPADGDWIKPAPLQRYNLGVTGGVQGFTYAVSFNFRDEGSPIDGSGVDLERTGYVRDGGARANFMFQPTPSLTVQWSSSLNGGTVQWVSEGTGQWGWSMHQTRGVQGSVTRDGKPAAGLLFLDPRFDKRKQTTTGLSIEHKLGERFTQRFVLGYDVNENTESFYEQVGSYNTPTGAYQETEWNHWTTSLDYGATFRTNFRGGELSSVTSAGFQAAQDVDKRVAVDASFFPGPVEVPTLTSGATRRISSDNRLRVINAGFFFQQMFGYKELLFVTAGLRVDGNSAFGESFGLQPYPKLSLSWILSDMDFWPRWSESFKLRAAMGDAGKAPGAFDAVRSWGAIVADDGKPGFTPGAVGNPNLGPERTREFELGFDGSFLQGRLTTETNVYLRRTTEALVAVSPIPSLGFASNQLTNIGVLENKGFEVSANGTIVRGERLTWDVGASYSVTKTEAVDLAGLSFTISPGTVVREGYPIPSNFGWRITNPDEKAAPIIEKDVFIGSVWPDRLMNVQTNLAFGGLRVGAVGDMQWGGHTLNQTSRFTAAREHFGPCYPAQQAQRKMLAGDGSDWANITAEMRLKCSLVPSEQAIQLWYEGNDFFKLRSVTLSYNLPDGWIPGAQRAALHLAGNNLWKHTDYWGTDPESKNSISSNTNSTNPIDYNEMPPFSTYTVSLSVGF